MEEGAEFQICAAKNNLMVTQNVKRSSAPSLHNNIRLLCEYKINTRWILMRLVDSDITWVRPRDKVNSSIPFPSALVSPSGHPTSAENDN